MCSTKCMSIFVVVLAILGYGLNLKIQNTHEGKLAIIKSFLKHEKHGKYGLSTAEDIASESGENFKGTVSIVTGANTGLGLETARVIGLNGGTVIMACRTPQRCEKGKAKIEAEVAAGGGELRCMKLDLGSLASVDAFVEEFLASGLELKYLVNNAGVMDFPDFRRTVEGHEMQYGVNHLGHFRLTTQLLDALKKTRGSRVINLSSLGHVGWLASDGVDKIPMSEAEYDGEAAYYSSKIANVLFTAGLRKRLRGSGVLTASGHPGGIKTELGRNNQDQTDQMLAVMDTAEKWFGWNPLKTIGQGTSTTLCMMLHDLPATGTEKLYFSDCLPGKPDVNYNPRLAENEAEADKLWLKSEDAVAAYLAKKSH